MYVCNNYNLMQQVAKSGVQQPHAPSNEPLRVATGDNDETMIPDMALHCLRDIRGGTLTGEDLAGVLPQNLFPTYSHLVRFFST